MMSGDEEDETKSAVFPCRGCLASDVKLYNIHDNELAKSYVNLIGISLKDPYSQYLCSICASLLQKFALFRERCVKSHRLLGAAEYHRKSIDEIDVSTYITPLPYVKTETQIHEYLPAFKADIETINVIPEVYFDVDDEIDYNDDSHVDDVDYSHDIKNEESDEEDNMTIAFLTNNYEKQKKARINIKLQKKKREPRFKLKTDEEIRDIAKSCEFEVKFLTKTEQFEEIEERKQYKSKRPNPSASICELCGKNCSTQLKMNEHYKRDHDENIGQYTCEICHWRFPYSSRLSRHLQMHRMHFECKVCGHKTKWLENLYNHNQQHKGKKHTCPYCEKTFIKVTTYFSHIRLTHSSELPWCELCGESFLNDRGMKFHKARVHKTVILNYACADCDSRFSSEAALDAHLASQRCDLVICVHCGDGFATQQLLKYHLISRHRPEMTLVDCEGCGVKFHNATALQRHLPACGATCCVQCGEHFESDELMMDHVTREHSNFKCEECKRTFSNAYYYRDHVNRVHLNRGDKPAGKRGLRRKPIEPRVRKWRPAGEDGVVMLEGEARTEQPRLGVMCEICGLVFNCKARLDIHLTTHSDVRPHQCDQCPKAFRTALALEYHTRVHTNERPFQCPSCPKAFKLSAALARHSLVHSGIRKHVCQICQKTFQTSTSVKMHIRHVHMKVPAPPRARARRAKDLG